MVSNYKSLFYVKSNSIPLSEATSEFETLLNMFDQDINFIGKKNPIKKGELL